MHKDVLQPVVISRDMKVDIAFNDIIGERHSFIGLQFKNNFNTIFNDILKQENLTLEDIVLDSLIVFKHGFYTLQFPDRSMKRKQVAATFKYNVATKSLVEVRVSMKDWLPFSKHRNVRDIELRDKLVSKEVATINNKNKTALKKTLKYTK